MSNTAAATTLPHCNAPAANKARIHAAKISAHIAAATATNPRPTGLQEYTPQDTDVLVATVRKAGTTLLQQLTYQVSLATGGSGYPPSGDGADVTGTSFSDICDVVPWLEYIPQKGGCYWHVATPRIFKTQARGDLIRGGEQRVVVGMRHPGRFAGSWMDFMCANWPCELTRTAGDDVRRILYDETVEEKILGTHPSSQGQRDWIVGRHEADGSVYGPWLYFYKIWFDVAKERKKNVLFLFYEDVVGDLAGAADKVAALIGKRLSAEGRARVARRCSREYMAGREQFRSVWDAMLFGIDALSTKVLSAERDCFAKLLLREEQAVELGRQMKKVFGVSSYSLMLLSEYTQ